MNNPRFRWLLAIFLSITSSARVAAQSWEVLTSGTDTSLRGLSAAVGSEGGVVVWATGSNGVVMVSGDEGKHWKRLAVTGGENLDFRGVVAFSESNAYLMSSGEGTKSRIYKTTDGGATWKLQFSDERKEFFLDAIQCLSETECYALGDPMDGKFVLLHAKDGEHWERVVANGLQALPQEGAFAASNSCLKVDRDGGIYFVTGGPAARMFHSKDAGKTWTVTEIPIAKGNASSGAFSIAVDGKTMVVVGGDYRDPKRGLDSAVYSSDGGVNWSHAAEAPGGFRSAVASISGPDFVTAGTSGSEFSGDSGAHWKHAGTLNLNAVKVLNAFRIWGVGPNGTVARFKNPSLYQIMVRTNIASRGGKAR